MWGRTDRSRAARCLCPNIVDWMPSIVSMAIVDDYVVVAVIKSVRYNTRAEIDQHPLHIEEDANSMWSLATMDLEIVTKHSDIDTRIYIDLEFLLAYSIALRIGKAKWNQKYKENKTNEIDSEKKIKCH